MGTAGSDVPHQVGWRVTTRVAHGASQLPRIAWYVGHSLAVRRLTEAAQRRGKKAQPRAHTKAHDRWETTRDVRNARALLPEIVSSQ